MPVQRRQARGKKKEDSRRCRCTILKRVSNSISFDAQEHDQKSGRKASDVRNWMLIHHLISRTIQAPIIHERSGYRLDIRLCSKGYFPKFRSQAEGETGSQNITIFGHELFRFADS